MTLELKNIDFSFTKKQVLKDVSIFFNQGQIHGLLGENGAGKSTLANIICGELKPSKGQILIDGKEVHFSSPKDAINTGICYVHQRPQLCENISVYENLILGLKLPFSPKKRKLLQEEIHLLTQKLIPSVNLKTPLYNVSSDLRFFISLTSALLKHPKILVLDEPSALINQKQIDFLYEYMNICTHEHMNIIIITHNLSEAEKYCNDTFLLKKESQPEINISSINKQQNQESGFQKKSIDLEWKNICCKTRNHIPLKNLNFNVKSGEITLIKGRGEDGLSLLEDIVQGMNSFKAQGQFIITNDKNETKWDLSKGFSTKDLRFCKSIKTGIIPTNKKYRGSFPELTVEQILTTSQKNKSAEELISLANINIQPFEKCENLSGGMLQRLMINRELAENPDFLILCNPLQGLDSTSEKNLCTRIKNLADNNTAILILSTAEFPSEICTWVYNLKKGELTKC